MNTLINSIKLLSLLGIFAHSNLYPQCCKKKPTEYMLLAPTSADLDPEQPQPPTVLRKAPRTKCQQAWTVCKVIGTGMIITGAGVGAYFLATNIIEEEGKVNSSLHDIKNEIGELHKFTDTASFSSECPEQLEQCKNFLIELLTNCTR